MCSLSLVLKCSFSIQYYYTNIVYVSIHKYRNTVGVRTESKENVLLGRASESLVSSHSSLNELDNAVHTDVQLCSVHLYKNLAACVCVCV